MNIEKQRYIESSPGTLEPRHKEELFALFENSTSKPPVSHPLFVKVRPYIKLLQQHAGKRIGAPSNKFYEVHCRSRAISAILQDKCIVHQEYNMPNGFDYYRLNIFCWYVGRSPRLASELLSVSHEELLSLRQEIVHKNPALQALSPYVTLDSTYDTTLDAIFGCASKFTVEDILFYISKRHKHQKKEAHDDFVARTQPYRESVTEAFERVHKRHPSMPEEHRMFISSPQTINKVERHLGLPETIFPELD